MLSLDTTLGVGGSGKFCARQIVLQLSILLFEHVHTKYCWFGDQGFGLQEHGPASTSFSFAIEGRRQ